MDKVNHLKKWKLENRYEYSEIKQLLETCHGLIRSEKWIMAVFNGKKRPGGNDFFLAIVALTGLSEQQVRDSYRVIETKKKKSRKGMEKKA